MFRPLNPLELIFVYGAVSDMYIYMCVCVCVYISDYISKRGL